MNPSSKGGVQPRAGAAANFFTAAPRVVVEREPAAADSDTATRQTVEKMCQYIREGAADSEVRRCAEYAWSRFGMGLASVPMKCWAVFWWLKHSVKFRLDEATMWRVGTSDEQDLLIAPSVLVRMQDPAEDCDGFTMLGAAMLHALGVPVIVATVAVNPRDPSRWSHVFPCAVVGSQVLPLDASHGSRPGWMVPASQISRWQAWTLDGRPSDVRPSPGLHGYRRVGPGFQPPAPAPLAVRGDAAGGIPPAWAMAWARARRRGVGDVLDTGGTDVPGGTFDPTGTDSVIFGPQAPVSSSGWTPAFWQGLINSGLNIVKGVVTPPAYLQTVRDPITGQLISTTVRSTATGATAFSAGAGGLSSNALMWGGLGVLVLVLAMSKGRQ